MPQFEIVVQVFAALLGLVVGSFLNVVIHRVPLKLSIVHPPSRCPNCKTQLKWYWNVPVLSWLALRGRCGKCRAPISPRYPLVELMTGLLAWALVVQFGPTPWALFQFVFVAALVAITFIDLDHMIIPDVISLPGIVVGLLGQLLLPEGDVVQALLAVAAGGGAFWLIAFLFEKLRGVEGMGGGDIKLLGMIGAFTSLFGVLQTVLVGSLIGSVVGIVYLAATRKGGQTRIPFGPFLAFGGLTASLFPTLLRDLLLAGVQ